MKEPKGPLGDDAYEAPGYGEYNGQPRRNGYDFEHDVFGNEENHDVRILGAVHEMILTDRRSNSKHSPGNSLRFS